MEGKFNRFLSAFPHDDDFQRIDAEKLSQKIQEQFDVATPIELLSFWQEVGAGYFADRELFVFPDIPGPPRGSFLEWNSIDCWQLLFPSPADGGPIFFAETCFGVQVGFRWVDGEPTGYLLDIDSWEAFRLGDRFKDVFEDVLTDRYALTDRDLLRGVRETLPQLASGMHYAPFVSPLVGGRRAPDNYHLETANVHLRTSIATWEAIQRISPSAE